MERKNRIFLCHAHEDKGYVLNIYDQLVKLGFDPWLDQKDILPGELWDNVTKIALQNSRIIILFFSNVSIQKKGYVQKEFKLAWEILQETPENQIYVIPVKIDDCVIPYSYQHIQHVNLYEKGGFQKVITVLEQELGVKKNDLNRL